MSTTPNAGGTVCPQCKHQSPTQAPPGFRVRCPRCKYTWTTAPPQPQATTTAIKEKRSWSNDPADMLINWCEFVLILSWLLVLGVFALAIIGGATGEVPGSIILASFVVLIPTMIVIRLACWACLTLAKICDLLEGRR